MDHRTCSVNGCSARHLARGMCQMHYARWSRLGSVDLPQRPDRPTRCEVVGCGKRRIALGLCQMHYERKRKGLPNWADPSEWKKRDGAGHLSPRDGYVTIYVDRKKVKEHRHLMELKIGRPLLRQEDVHHKNGVRHDNRIGNLELWSHSQPRGQRAVDKLAWAREIIALYQPLEDAGLI